MPNEITAVLAHWQIEPRRLREEMYRAPTPRERERWHALWLLSQGWSAAAVARAFERDPHTIGTWLDDFRQHGPAALAFAHTGGSPALTPAGQADLKAALQAAPRAVAVEQAQWSWKGVCQFIAHRVGRHLDHSTCLRYLHRLGFVRKRPKKRLLKADAAKRAAFVARYAALRVEAQVTGATIWFVDEAHFRADADLRLMWVPKGQPALVDSTSPRWGEKASYYSAVCLETGAVEVMDLDGNSCAETSVAFLKQLRAKQAGPLIVIWDNGAAHGGQELRDYLTTPDLTLRLVRLPAYSPDYNADEHIWAWVREEVTANTCFGTAAKVREAVGAFFAGLAERGAEVKRRCQTLLQAAVEPLLAELPQMVSGTAHVVPVRESV